MSLWKLHIFGMVIVIFKVFMTRFLFQCFLFCFVSLVTVFCLFITISGCFVGACRIKGLVTQTNMFYKNVILWSYHWILPHRISQILCFVLHFSIVWYQCMDCFEHIVVFWNVQLCSVQDPPPLYWIPKWQSECSLPWKL